jgi:3-dehydroquinate synthase
MKMKFSELNTEITLAAKGFGALGEFIRQKTYSRIAVITSEPVASLYLPQITAQIPVATVIRLPLIEEVKTMRSVEACWLHMQEAGLDRYSLAIGLGGGVVTDVTGFAAACYMRGIDCAYVPTTLMGMVDAALGGKNGVNLGSYKNYIGAIRQPKRVSINLHCLNTLPEREFKSGMAEIIKSGIIFDADLFDFVETNIERILAKEVEPLSWMIQRACYVKMSIVEQDPYEKGIRAFLNFGHTYGHALEGLLGYKGLTHGECVAIGMTCAARVAVQLALCDESILRRIEAICHRTGLPTEMPNVDRKQLISLMRSDKKSENKKLTLILPRRIGQVEKCDNISEETILASLTAGVCCG